MDSNIEEEHALYMFGRIIQTRNSNRQITLISGKDEKRFSISRAILAAASKYFETMLGSDFGGSNQSEFILDKVDGETIQGIIDFCYTGRIKISEENVDELFAAANYYQIDRLQRKCCEMCDFRLIASNAVQTLLTADKLSLSKLRQWSFEFVCASLAAIPSADIQQIDHQLLHEILISDAVTVPEEFIFERLMDWYEHSRVEREKMMPTLLQCVRLEHITAQFLIETVDAVYRKFNCSELMIKEYQRRVSNPSMDIYRHRLQQIYCVSYKEDTLLFKNVQVRVEKYSIPMNKFEFVGEITSDVTSECNLVLFENKLFIFGGLLFENPSDAMVSFDLFSAEWDNLPVMKCAVLEFTTIVFGACIYKIGGFDRKENVVNSCERFNTKTKKWDEIEPMITGRSLCAAATMNGCIIVAGGFSTDWDKLISVEKYDPLKDEWINLAAMNKTRVDFTLATSGSFLYAMGCAEMVEKYDPLKNEWQTIGSFDDSDDIRVAVNIGDNLLLVITSTQLGKYKIDEPGLGSYTRLLDLEKGYRRNLYSIQN